MPDTRQPEQDKTPGKKCSGTQCELLNPVIGETHTASLDTFEFVLDVAETIGTRHCITLVTNRALDRGMDRTVFGAWTEHRHFRLSADHAILDEPETDVQYTGTLEDS